MGNNLEDRLEGTVKKLKSKGKLNEKDIDEMMRDVRLSLLEADVNFRVVKQFTERVKQKAIGEKVINGLNPGEMVIKIVHDELKKIMGDETSSIKYQVNKPTVIMIVGLQGSGKTTVIAKLAAFLRKQDKKKPYLIAADVYRPAAIDQLKKLGSQINVPVYNNGEKDPRKIVKTGLVDATKSGYDLVIIDTAGRLHIDNEMMDELVDLKKIAEPDEILLTVDAMTGQDAANICKSFNDKLNATGAILTKLDGDTRGGSALSIKEVSNLSIKYSSFGETLDTIEIFHPDRMAKRILGMGDVLTLIEKAEQEIDEDEAMSLMEKLANDTFDFNDLLKQFEMIKKMGKISRIIGFIPFVGKKFKDAAKQIKEADFYRFEVLVHSMTEKERKDPNLVIKSSSRKKRIADGAGKNIKEVQNLLEALEQQKKAMKQMANMSEEDIRKLKDDPSKMQDNFTPKQKKYKGKGKGKGNFRF